MSSKKEVDLSQAGLMTEFTRLDDMDLITRYDATAPTDKVRTIEKTGMLVELLLRMGNGYVFCHATKEQVNKVVEELKYADEQAEAAGAAKNEEGLALWYPVTARLSFRLALAASIYKEMHGKAFDAVEEGP
jgi:hypothetical protein